MEKFIKFLEDNNAWENFERNFIEQKTNVAGYKNTCKIRKNQELDTAFGWELTKEGVGYWSKLNDKWKQKNNSLKEQLLSND